jgi:hypothetical protein
MNDKRVVEEGEEEPKKGIAIWNKKKISKGEGRDEVNQRS